MPFLLSAKFIIMLYAIYISTTKHILSLNILKIIYLL